MKSPPAALKVWIAAGLIGAAGTAIVTLQCRSELARARAEARRQLESLAAEQAAMTARWVEDARVDLRMCLEFGRASGETLAAYRTLLKRPDYAWIQYVDPAGRRVAGAFREGGAKPLPDPRALTAALRGRDGALELVWDSARGRLDVDLALPDRDGGAAAGALFARMDPRVQLFGALRAGQAFSASAETQIGRREGDEVFYLSGLREGAGLTRRPLASPRSPMAKALRGVPLDGSEIDRRGRRVLAVAAPVAGTDWTLVTKVDDAEIAGPALRGALWRWLVGLCLLAIGSISGLLFVRRQETRHAERELAAHLELLAKSQELDAFFSHSLTPVVFLDPEFNFLRVNEAYAKSCARKVEDFPGHNHFEFYPHAENEGIFRQVVRAQRPYRAEAKPFEFPDHPEWGRTYWDWTLVPILDASGAVEFLVFSLQDVTERVRAEQEVRAKADELEDAYNNAPCGYHSLGEDGTYLRVNDTELSWLGYRREEVVGVKKFSDLVTPAGVKLFRDEFPAFQERGWVRDLEFDMVRKDGSILPVLLSATGVKDDAGRFVMSRGTIYDVTDRRRAQEAQARLAAMVESSDDAIVGETLDGVVTSWNEGARRLYGWTAAEAVGESAGLTIPPGREDEEARILQQIRRGKRVGHYETERRCKDGRLLRISLTVSPILDASGAIVGASSVGRDVTQRWEAEQAVARLARAMRTLSQCNQALVRAQSEGELLERICGLIVETGGYRLAWVGFRVDDAARSVRPVAQAGYERGYLETLGLTWADAERGRGPTGSAIREGAIRVCRDFDSDPALAPWREEALKRGYRASVALPLRTNGEVFGALTIYAAEAGAFAEEEVSLLEELSEDLAYGVASQRARAAREAAETALRESEASLADAQRIAHLGGWEWRVPENRLRWSDEMYRIFGVEPRSFPATYEAFLAAVHPDDRAGVDAAVQDALAGRAPYRVDCRIVKPDGSVRRAHAEGEVIRDDAGRARVMRGTVLDATEAHEAAEGLRRSETRFRRLFEASTDGIVLLDAATGKVQDANGAILRLLGCSREDLRGSPLWETAAFRQAAEDAPALRELAARGVTRLEDLVLRAKDGREVVVDFVASSYDSDGGRVIQCGVRDVSERKRLQAQVLHAQKMESVGVLAGGIAHDFNNILMTILADCSFVLSSLASNDPRRADVEEIKAAGERAAALTRQLLIFSRKQPAQPIVLDVNELIRNLRKMLGRLLGEDVRIEEDLLAQPVLVRADAGQLEQVITNLAVNAREAMPRGGRLILRTRRLGSGETCHRDCAAREAGRSVRLEVEDTGCGMTPEVQARLFEPFFTTKPVGKGTGLGLSTVYGIVRQAGGGVGVRSEVGKGTTFAIDLPLAEAGEPAAAPAPAPAPASAAAGAEERRETILLVEDDDTLRRIDLRVLQERGYRVLPARDGSEALDLLQNGGKDADLLLTDVVMPGIGGWELASEALKRKPDLKVIFVSGYVEHGALEQILAGRHEFLQKPVEPEALARKVREVLDRKPAAA